MRPFDPCVGNLEVLRLLPGVLGGRIGFDLGSKIDVETVGADFPESMLSPAWEHGFSESGRS